VAHQGRPAQQEVRRPRPATPVIGDVSGDGKPDIIYSGRQDAQKLGLVVHAVDGDGTLLWTGHNAQNVPVKIRWDRGAAAMANLDADPEAEIADRRRAARQRRPGGVEPGRQERPARHPDRQQAPPSLLYIGGLPTFADLTATASPSSSPAARRGRSTGPRATRPRSR
jgi:hypothetical protein